MKKSLLIALLILPFLAQAEKWKGNAYYSTNSLSRVTENCFFDIQYPASKTSGHFAVKISYNPKLTFTSSVRDIEHPATDSRYQAVPVNFDDNNYYAYSTIKAGKEIFHVRIDLDLEKSGQFKVTNIYYREFSTNISRVNQYKHKNSSDVGMDTEFLNGQLYKLVLSRHCFPITKLSSY